MAKKIAPVVPDKVFTSGGANYKFQVAQFYHNGVLYTAEEALGNQELLDDLVATSRKVKDKPEVADGILKLVESATAAPAGGSSKLAPAADVIALIGAAKTADEVDALIAGDTRKTVQDAAAKQKATF